MWPEQLLFFHGNTIVLIAKESKRTPCKNKQNSWLKRVEYDKWLAILVYCCSSISRTMLPFRLRVLCSFWENQVFSLFIPTKGYIDHKSRECYMHIASWMLQLDYVFGWKWKLSHDLFHDVQSNVSWVSQIKYYYSLGVYPITRKVPFLTHFHA